MHSLILYLTPDGTISEFGFVISPPETSTLNEYVLLISCRGIPILNTEVESVFTFIGGFSESRKIEDDQTFLVCSYPADDYEKLLKKIGSIDFEQSIK